MRNWILGLCAVYPVAWRSMELRGKPVDIVASDVLFVLILLIPARRMLIIPASVSLKKLATVRVAAVLFIMYSLGLSMVSFGGTTELARVVSALKLVKPLAYILLGAYLAGSLAPVKVLRRIGIAFSMVVVATAATAVSNPDFPRGAWGSHLFSYELYGYPNSAMSFYGVMLPLVVACADTTPRGVRRLVLYACGGLTALIVVSSLSRSSTLAMTTGLLIYLFITGRMHIPIVATAFVAVGLAASAGLLIQLDIQNAAFQQLKNNLERRYSQTVGAEDPLSGRGDIWADTLELTAERPVFGYAFEPYSRYSEFDTPHQQYLEILYKTGGLGLVIYLWVLLASLEGLVHLKRNASRRSEAWYFLSAVFAATSAAMLGNLSQPNLTYSVTGNCLFLMIGLMLNRHGAAALVDPAPVQTAPPAASIPLPEVSQAAEPPIARQSRAA